MHVWHASSQHETPANIGDTSNLITHEVHLHVAIIIARRTFPTVQWTCCQHHRMLTRSLSKIPHYHEGNTCRPLSHMSMVLAFHATACTHPMRQFNTHHHTTPFLHSYRQCCTKCSFPNPSTHLTIQQVIPTTETLNLQQPTQEPKKVPKEVGSMGVQTCVSISSFNR